MTCKAIALGSVFALILLPILTGSAAETGGTIQIRVQGDDWKVPPENVKAVLDSTAAQLMEYFPGRQLKPILVSRGSPVPITLNDKGPAGEYRVKLACDSTYWAQYTYQFAHELCHILSNYDHHHGGRNQWFEESLCETSSLFALSRMDNAWATSPPYPNWKNWGIHFDDYLNALLADRKRRLPPDRTMRDWMAENLPQLESEDHLTDRSKLVAAYLLPLFQDDPHGWEALNWLNLGPDDDRLPFRDYLEAWRSRIPAEHKAFVGRIQTLLGYANDAKPTPAAAR